jgi:CheY-like chemotaxis protein
MRPTILVADDDPLMRAFIEDYLASAGLIATFVEDGEMAVDALETGDFNLVVTDMVMPNLDGLELIKQARRAAPAARILAISAGVRGANAEVTLRAALSAGASAVLVKPFTRTEFLQAVSTILQQLPPAALEASKGV